MPKKSAPSRAKKSAAKVSKAPAKTNASLQSSYLKLRQQVESMKELHAVVLVIMVALVAGMFMILSKQKREIAELQFQVGFLEERYNIWRDKGFKDIEAKTQQGQPTAPESLTKSN